MIAPYLSSSVRKNPWLCTNIFGAICRVKRSTQEIVMQGIILAGGQVSFTLRP